MMRTTTGISLSTDLKRAAERQAKREQRSLSSLINFALAQYLGELGVWKEVEPDDAEGSAEQERDQA